MKSILIITIIFFSFSASAQKRVSTKKATNKVVSKKAIPKKVYNQQISNGLVKLDKSYFHYKSILTSQIKEEIINYLNNSKDTVELYFKNTSKYISAQTLPQFILPQQAGIIKLSYDASKRVNKKGQVLLGKDYKRIPIYIKGKEKSRNPRTDFITFRTFVNEDFSHLSKKELKHAPVIKFDTITYNFGKVTQGTVVVHDFIFENYGKNDLEIRYAKGCWGCYVVGKTDTVVTKGNKGFVKAKFDTRRRRGRQVKSITVLTNDPKKSNIVLKLTGEIVAPSKKVAPVSKKS